MMKKILVFIFLAICFPVQSQLFTIFNIDRSDYPNMKARFVAIDSTGKQLTGLNLSDIRLFENNQPAELISIENPLQPKVEKLSVIIKVDISGSMNGFSLRLVKDALKSYVSKLPLVYSECAIISFNHNVMVNSDFTKNESKIEKCIEYLESEGGTDYDLSFNYNRAGSLELFKNAQCRKIEIFISDGLGEILSGEIEQETMEKEISVFPIIIYKAPESIKSIAKSTGAECFENINTIEKFQDALSKILALASVRNSSVIRWKSNQTCTDSIKVKAICGQLSIDFAYKLSKDQISKIDFDPMMLLFGSIKPGESKSIQLKITAKYFPVSITNIDYTGKEIISIDNLPSLPLALKPNESLILNVTFTPKDSGNFFSRILIENSLCSPYKVWMNGGFPGKDTKILLETPLSLQFPNGGEVFPAGADTIAKWKGINENDQIDLKISTDMGRNWKNSGHARRNSTAWKIPQTLSRECLMKVKLNPFDSSIFLVKRQIVNYSGDFQIHMNGDQSLVYTSGPDSIIKTWDLSNLELKDSILKLSPDLNCTAVHPDGKHILTSGYKDAQIKLHDLRTNNLINFRKHKKRINSLEFSKDGKYFVSASDDKRAVVWNFDKRKAIGSFKHKSALIVAKFNSDASLIGTLEDYKLTVWDIKTRKKVYEYSNIGHINYDFDFKGDQSVLLAGVDGTSEILSGDEQKDILKEPTKLVRFIRQKNKILVITQKNNILVLDAANNDTLYQASTKNEIVNACISDDGSKLITSSNNGSMSMWMLSDELDLPFDVSDHPFKITAMIPKMKDVSFDPVLQGFYADLMVPGFVSNPNEMSISVKQIRIAGKDSVDFKVISGNFPFIIAPKSGQKIEFRYKPNRTGISNANIELVTAGGTYRSKISGKCLPLLFYFLENPIDFGQVKVGDYVDRFENVISNEYRETLNIEKIENGGPDTIQFRLPERKAAALVKSNEVLRLMVRYISKSRGLATGSIKIYLKDIKEPIIIQLFGEGIAPRKVTLYGQIFDSKDNKPLKAEFNCHDLASDLTIEADTTKADGSYSLLLDADRSWSIIASKDGYLTASDNLNLEGIILNDSVRRDIYLSPFEKGARVRLNNIFFEFAKAELTSASRAELDRLYKLLSDYPSLWIKIEGHTDNIGTNAANLILSQNRANAVKEYLVKKGIKPGRLISEGFGSKWPIASNETDEGRLFNRRVEFTILKIE